ncbi:MAG: hypothetical protein ACWGQW_19480 [bacterium]
MISEAEAQERAERICREMDRESKRWRLLSLEEANLWIDKIAAALVEAGKEPSDGNG